MPLMIQVLKHPGVAGAIFLQVDHHLGTVGTSYHTLIQSHHTHRLPLQMYRARSSPICAVRRRMVWPSTEYGYGCRALISRAPSTTVAVAVSSVVSLTDLFQGPAQDTKLPRDRRVSNPTRSGSNTRFGDPIQPSTIDMAGKDN